MKRDALSRGRRSAQRLPVSVSRFSNALPPRRHIARTAARLAAEHEAAPPPKLRARGGGDAWLAHVRVANTKGVVRGHDRAAGAPAAAASVGGPRLLRG